MSDLISRADVVDMLEMYPFAEFSEYEVAREVVKRLPSAQPEIIRCKDCIYFDRYTDGIEKYQWDGFCADWARNTYEDWFCSRAERKGEQP